MLSWKANTYYDLIPNCLLLHLEAGRNLETFIASTYGLKPFSSTDTNLRKTAIMTKLKRLSLSLGRENESEKPPKPPLRASIAPELLLLTCCPLGLHKIGFPQAGSTELPPDPLGRGRWANLTPSGILLSTTGQGYLHWLQWSWWWGRLRWWRPLHVVALDGCPPGDEED